MNVLQRAALFAAIGVAAVVALGGELPGAKAAVTSAIISNGTVQLGVFDTGNLNAPSNLPSCGGTTEVGLRFVPTNCDSTSPGCTCEGWGAADKTSATSGSANDADGVYDMTVESFTSDASSAVSKVMLKNGLRVTHDYHPSLVTPNLYEVVVTIENTSAAEVHLLYRRVMDWDIEPTPFNEFVTMVPGTVTSLVHTSSNGFDSADPLDTPADSGYVTGAFVDAGPDDHGALFDFDFGPLPVGFSKRIVTFYGAAATEVDALAALTAVGAEAYSLGEPSGEGGKDLGTPNTFMFAFGKVDSVVFEETPPAAEPTATPAACIPPLVGIICTAPPGGGGGGGGGGGSARPTATAVASTPAPQSTVAAATVVPTAPTRVSQPLGVIVAPDTGDGSGTAGGNSPALLLMALAASGVALAGAGALKVQVRRRD